MTTTLRKHGRILVDPGGVYPPGAEVRQSAVLSEDEVYRYSLVRRWHFPGLLDLERTDAPATFIMLNPSTADGTLDDPTIRRCVGFARDLGLAGIVVLNLYAYRATEPADLWQAQRSGVDVVGPETDRLIVSAAARCRTYGTPLVAAWGAGAKTGRVAEVLELVRAAGTRLTALGLTKAGAPRHPLYVRGDTVPQPFHLDTQENR
jgi:hypothetical protein